jgi:hypothetical protein
MVDLGRATELTVAKPMTVQPEFLAGGRLAAPQSTQAAGLALSGDGGDARHPLTSSV